MQFVFRFVQTVYGLKTTNIGIVSIQQTKFDRIIKFALVQILTDVPSDYKICVLSEYQCRIANKFSSDI